MINISEAYHNFIGSAAENDTWTGNYAREYQYVEWLIRTELGDDPSEEDLDALWQRYCAEAYRLDEFNAEVPA